MYKKFVSSFILIIFSVFTFSCSIHVKKGMRRERIEKVSSRKKQKYRILSVTKTTGEIIEFYGNEPGKIVSNTIVGAGWIKKDKIEIERKNIKIIKRLKDKPAVLFTKDGQIIDFSSLKEEKDKIILGKTRIRKSVRVPFSEIYLVNLKKPTHIITYMVLGLTVVVILSFASFIHSFED